MIWVLKQVSSVISNTKFCDLPTCGLYKNLLTRRYLQSHQTMEIKTFIFLDTETTGLPHQENNKTRITELCLSAIQSDHLKIGIIPRIQNKINLCFNPRKYIHPLASQITGISEDLLQQQPEFSYTTFKLIEDFIKLQQQPICFVAHNGYRFDYPILRAEINDTANEFEDHILCIDTLVAFRELCKEDNKKFKETSAILSQNANYSIELQDGFDEILSCIADDVEKSIVKKLFVEEVQELNETTPKKHKETGKKMQSSGIKKVQNDGCSKRHFSGSSRLSSFKLGDVYHRLTSKTPSNAHRAEYDVNMLMECAVSLGERFIDWSNKNAKKFCDIPIMEPGRPIGT